MPSPTGDPTQLGRGTLCWLLCGGREEARDKEQRTPPLTGVSPLQPEQEGLSPTSPTFGVREDDQDLGKALRVERFEEILQDSHPRNVEEAGRSYSEEDFECMHGGGTVGVGMGWAEEAEPESGHGPWELWLRATGYLAAVPGGGTSWGQQKVPPRSARVWEDAPRPSMSSARPRPAELLQKRQWPSGEPFRCAAAWTHPPHLAGKAVRCGVKGAV